MHVCGNSLLIMHFVLHINDLKAQNWILRIRSVRHRITIISWLTTKLPLILINAFKQCLKPQVNSPTGLFCNQICLVEPINMEFAQLVKKMQLFNIILVRLTHCMGNTFQKALDIAQWDTNQSYSRTTQLHIWWILEMKNRSSIITSAHRIIIEASSSCTWQGRESGREGGRERERDGKREGERRPATVNANWA